MCKKWLFIFFVLFWGTVYPSVGLAIELNLPQSSINPDNSMLYPFKRLFEKTMIFSKVGNQSKAGYYRELTLVRMAELTYVVEQKSLSDVQQSTQRLSAQIGVLVDLIATDKTELGHMIPDIRELLTSCKEILIHLRDQYPANSSFWMLVQHSINSIDLNLDKLK